MQSFLPSQEEQGNRCARFVASHEGAVHESMQEVVLVMKAQ